MGFKIPATNAQQIYIKYSSRGKEKCTGEQLGVRKKSDMHEDAIMEHDTHANLELIITWLSV